MVLIPLEYSEYASIIDDVLLGTDKATCLPQRIELAKLFKQSESEKRKLRVKLGIDPTSTDLHLGHTVCLHALRKFQKYGHMPVLIIGGFTAMVGDPSGRNETRPPLSYEEVEENAKTYLEQVSKILNMEKDISGKYKYVEVFNNYEWFKNFSLSKLLELAHIVTVNQLIAKEAFGKRIEDSNPLYLHEVLYPILQGYDSVQVNADIEIGGVDQTFNILFGRHVQKYFKQKEQIAILYPLLIGLDGSKKMSKTFNNYIALNDDFNDVFGKAMSIPDELITDYFSLVTDLSLKDIQLYRGQLERYKKGSQANTDKSARDIKMELAHKLVAQLYDESMANKAMDNFIKQFQKNEIPDSVNEYILKKPLKIVDLMYLAKMVPSKSEAKRLIEGGGVRLKSIKVEDPNLLITNNDKNSVLQIGKRKFVKIV